MKPALYVFTAYYGCRTPEVTVKVYSKLAIRLVAPAAVRPNEETDCWVEILEGSGIQSLQPKLDGANHGSAITSVGGRV